MRIKWVFISILALTMLTISCGKKEEAVIEEPTLVQGVTIETMKLSPVSEDYEAKQKHYLEDLEKIARWED